MDAPTVKDQCWLTYKSLGKEKQTIYGTFISRRYQEISESDTKLTRQTRIDVQTDIIEKIMRISIETLREDRDAIINNKKTVGEWLREADNKTAKVAEKTLEPSSKAVDSVENAVVRHKKDQGSQKKWRPKKSLPAKPPEASQAVPNTPFLVTEGCVPLLMKTMPVEKFNVDPLQAEFKKVTDKALYVKETLPGGKKNEFADKLRECKQMLDTIKGSILMAQKTKETLSLLAVLVDQPDTYPSEFSRYITPLKNIDKDLEGFVVQNQQEWTNMMNSLKKLKKDSLNTKSLNHIAAYYCLKQMEVHVAKLNHRIWEIQDLYNRNPTLQKYKDLSDNCENKGEHILMEDNKGDVVDRSFADLYHVLSAKELIDLVIDGNSLISSPEDYAQKPYSNYQVLFDKTFHELKDCVAARREKIEQTIKDLDVIIKNNDKKDFSEDQKNFMRAVHSEESYNTKLAKIQKCHNRKYAATTQKLILQAILEKIDVRMSRKGMYLIKVSKGFAPLYEQFSELVNSLKSQT